ncbi:MAG TPA: amidase [Gemmatimonadaceae bacterium]|nr:amidase [Gemmatimonadaceae bacterium]
MRRRHFLSLTASAAAGATLPGPDAASRAITRSGNVTEPRVPPPFELDEVTVADLQAGMASGRWTSAALAEMYLWRIEQVDRRGPNVNAVLEANPDALAIAAERDAERRAGRVRGPLHGVPVLIKDNIDTGDRMLTSAGSLALMTSTPRDAFIVRRLRDAGAVLLGKTNLSEWANFRSTRSSSGWSARGGQTKNPYALDRNPCGSSSGTGAAIAANFAAVGIGTETDGSIVCPAHANGLVGIKPTIGLVSRTGIVPISHSQDTAGPMARTVADAVVMLAALAGPDPDDPATTGARGRIPDWTAALAGAALRGRRLGVARQMFGFNPHVDRTLERGLAALRDGGAELIDIELPTRSQFGDSEYEVLLYEFKADLERYLAARGAAAPYKTLAQLIEFNERTRDREMPYFGQEIFEMSVKKGPLTDKAYTDAVAKNARLTRTDGIDAAVRAHRLDAIVAPTGGPAWPTDLINGDHFGGGSSAMAAVAGYPNITVPAGQVFGLPIGLSFFGAAFSEERLIGIAAGFERVLDGEGRAAPTFRESVGL